MSAAPSRPARSFGADFLALIALGRPLFLVGGVVFYALGMAAAAHDGVAPRWSLALWGYLAVCAAQLMNHYSNDYYDLAADQANSTATPWSGGSRVLAEGRLPPRIALRAAVVCAVVAVALACVAALQAPASLASLALLLCSTGLAWVYSGPPLFLHRRGLGELLGAVVIPGLTAAVGYQLQSGGLGMTLLLAVLPLCLLQFAMLVAVSVPDAAGDAAVGKRTLVVVLGQPTAARLYLGALGLAFLTLPLLALGGLPLAVVFAPLGVLPIVLWNGWQAARGAWADGVGWAGLGFWSIGQLVGGATLMLLGFVWANT